MDNFFEKKNLYFIAEIGGNHQGSYEKAIEICELAISSGADCVKFQLYKADSLVNPILSKDRHIHFQKFELTKEQHISLAKKCIDSGVDYAASIWDLEMLEWIDPYTKFYKIGSGDLTSINFLKEFAKRGKPIVLSTGLSNIKEVHKIVNYIRSFNPLYKEKGMIILMQCTSMYPIKDSDANLSVISEFAKLENIIPGYSDHTIGENALVNSISWGAKVIEFHFTDNKKNKSFRDHQVSLELNEVIELKKKCLQAQEMIGNPTKIPLEIELSNNHVKTFRRGIYPKISLEKGQIITEKDLICLRPCEGISAIHYDQILGKELLVSVDKFQVLEWGMFK